MANDILEQAKKRLAEIEEEAAMLHRMIAAAEQRPVEAAPAPAPVPQPLVPSPGALPWPQPYSPPYQPDLLTPWIVWPKRDHGGACACGECCPVIFGRTTDKATFPPRYECQHNSTCGCGCHGWLWCGTAVTATATATLPLHLPSDSAIIYGNTDGLAVDRTRYTGSVMLS